MTAKMREGVEARQHPEVFEHRSSLCSGCTKSSFKPSSAIKNFSHSKHGIVCRTFITFCSPGSTHLVCSSHTRGWFCEVVQWRDMQSLCEDAEGLNPYPHVQSAVPYVVISHMQLAAFRAVFRITCLASRLQSIGDN